MQFNAIPFERLHPFYHSVFGSLCGNLCEVFIMHTETSRVKTKFTANIYEITRLKGIFTMETNGLAPLELWVKCLRHGYILRIEEFKRCSYLVTRGDSIIEKPLYLITLRRRSCKRLTCCFISLTTLDKLKDSIELFQDSEGVDLDN